jgi:hypothetical protein
MTVLLEALAVPMIVLEVGAFAVFAVIGVLLLLVFIAFLLDTLGGW